LEESSYFYFLKNQLNLNRFFIEKSLYKFEELDWVYYYYLPKTYQYLLYKYSVFVEWVLLDTSSLNLNKNQINQLVEINKLNELLPIKVNKKL